LQKRAENSPSWLGNGIADSLNNAIRWNQVDQIVYHGVLDAYTKFDVDRSNCKDILTEVSSKREQKIRSPRLNLRFLSVCMAQ
jgi:hypothetical protein